MRFIRPAAVILLILFFDQALKFWVKLHFTYGESREIFSWFHLYFIENEGMAFGMTLGGDSGKLMLSVFRLLAVFGIGYYLIMLINRKANPGFIISMSMIFAGAMGNILDSVFYGKIFTMSTQTIPAQLLSPEGGYANWLHGRVVDMLYFPLVQGFFPDWIPVWGGDSFLFFRPIFNLADASISCGVILIVLFQKRFFGKRSDHEMQQKEETPMSSAIEKNQEAPPENE